MVCSILINNNDQDSISLILYQKWSKLRQNDISPRNRQLTPKFLPPHPNHHFWPHSLPSVESCLPESQDRNQCLAIAFLGRAADSPTRRQSPWPLLVVAFLQVAPFTREFTTALLLFTRITSIVFRKKTESTVCNQLENGQAESFTETHPGMDSPNLSCGSSIEPNRSFRY